MKWFLTPLLIFSTIGFANFDAKDQFSTPMPQFDWESTKVKDPNNFNYVAFPLPGISVGHRTRDGRLGWDANGSVWTIGIFTLFKGSVSRLWYSEGDSPFYVGLGAYAGAGVVTFWGTSFGGWYLGPEIRLGRQIRTAKGLNLFIQAEMAYAPSLLIGIWDYRVVPGISIGVSY